ncbi:MAG: molecular chaperone GrpE [Candidatus Atribacteria bacterium]|nr:molecular chaperone GrpE [Candidatus Atribacteria bacterium]
MVEEKERFLEDSEEEKQSLKAESEEKLIENVEAELEELRKSLEDEREKVRFKEEEAQNYLNSLKKVKADFDNFRKREMVYRQNFVKKANKGLILELLPILDDLEKALEESRKKEVDPPFVQGVELIYKKFLGVLEKEGVRPIEAVGQKFDPKYHEAMMVVSLPDREDYEVVEELRKGYLYHDEVIRAAQVKVNKNSQDKLA